MLPPAGTARRGARGDEHVEAVVRDLAGEAAVDDKSPGEGVDEPKQSAGDGQLLLAPDVECKAEKHKNDEREGDACIQRFARAPFPKSRLPIY